MAESEIPADIEKLAINIVTDLCVKRGQHGGFEQMENEWLEQRIAKAIAAERERRAEPAIWKTTDEVIAAVREGGEVTEIELRYAVRNLSIWQNGLVFPLARACTEDPVSAKTRRELQRSYDNMRTGNAAPLDVRLKGSSYEPGLSKEERTDRFVRRTADTAVRLADGLAALRQDNPNET